MRPPSTALWTLSLLLVTGGTASAQRAPNVDVWFDGGNAIAPGETAPIRYRSDRPSYTTVVEVDEDGSLRMLGDGRSNNRSKPRAARSGSAAFTGREGNGYVFAIGSSAPLDFRGVGRSSDWSGARGGRNRTDPFETVDRFARGIARRGTYSIAYAPYSVAGRYRDERRRAPGSVRFDDGYGGYDYYDAEDYYGDDWRSSQYRRAYDGYAYHPYDQDPRSRYDRHCPDGTLVPYTVPCANGYRRRWSDGGDGSNTLSGQNLRPTQRPPAPYPAPSPRLRPTGSPALPTPPRTH